MSSPSQQPLTDRPPSTVGETSDSRPNTRGSQSQEIPQELVAGARSLLQQSVNSSTMSGSSRRKKKKKPPPPPQAHPEPRGADEAEVRMMWNRIAPPMTNGNKMTTPNEPPTLYSHASTTAIAGGLQDQPSIASLTQNLVDPPRNLLIQARGPLEVFVANGSHPKIGWLVPDQCQLGVKPQSLGGEIQLTAGGAGGGGRPRTSDSHGSNTDDFGGDNTKFQVVMSSSANGGGGAGGGGAPYMMGTEPLTLQPFEPPSYMLGLQQQYQQGERASMMLSMQQQQQQQQLQARKSSADPNKDDPRSSSSRSRRRRSSATAASSSQRKDGSDDTKTKPPAPTSPMMNNNNNTDSASASNEQQISSFLSSAQLLQQPELKDLIQNVQAKPPEGSLAMMMNDRRFANDNNNNNNNNNNEKNKNKNNNSLSIQERKQMFQDRIALLTNFREDGETVLTEHHLEDCTQWMIDLATAVQNERHLFTQWKMDLTDDIRQLQLDRAKAQADHEEEEQQVQADQRAALYLKENDLENLKSKREQVVDALTEKKRILRELQETSIHVEEAERASTLKILDVEEDLKKQRGRLEDVLKAKLQNAVEQMTQLSEAQRKARESSTVEDFNRLVKELTEQEQKMRELNSSSAKIQNRIAVLKREISLESQRGQMLQEKQETYHSTISTLVHRLEEIERKYSAQSQRELTGLVSGIDQQQQHHDTSSSSSPSGTNSPSANPTGTKNGAGGDQASSNKNDRGNTTSNSNNVTIDISAGATASSTTKKARLLIQQQQQAFLMNQQLNELPQIIDQQYSVILQLRADLIRVRQEVAQATEHLKQERTAVVAAANPSHQPILSRVAKKEQTREYMIEQNLGTMMNRGDGGVEQGNTNSALTMIKPRPPSTSSTTTTTTSRPNTNNSQTRNNIIQQQQAVSGSAPGTASSVGSGSGGNRHHHHHHHHQLRTLTAGQLSVVDTMRTSEMNFVKNIVFEALADADHNLVSVVNNHHDRNRNNNNNNNNNTLLPPVYPVLDVLDPSQRRDVFDFVVRRINTKMLNPLKESAMEQQQHHHYQEEHHFQHQQQQQQQNTTTTNAEEELKYSNNNNTQNHGHNSFGEDDVSFVHQH